MWWLLHMLHNSEGNGVCVGNGCCDRSLVIYTAALMEERTAGLPGRPQVLPCSTQQHTLLGASDLLWLGWGMRKRWRGEQQASSHHVPTT